MLRIGICDDERDMRFALRYKLERIFEVRGLEYEIYEFSSGDRLLDWYAKNMGRLEMLFLDIEMSGRNGMETAKALRSADSTLQLVFVTGYSDYVFDGYSVAALDYLMKPPDSDTLNDIITRALAALHLQADEVFVCRGSEGAYRIPKAAILYLSSDKRLITCVVQNRSYTFYARLDDVARELGSGFVRIHQRYLVNPAAVERISATSVQIGTTSLPISRAYQKESTLALTRALLNERK